LQAAGPLKTNVNDMAELATIVLAFSNLYCSYPEIVDIRAGDRFGENVISVSVPTELEVQSLVHLPQTFQEVRVYINPIIGLGTFTSETDEYLEVNKLMMVSPYNIHGTEENKWLDKKMRELNEKEIEIWKFMDDDAKKQSLRVLVKDYNDRGFKGFGNCLN